MRDYRQIIQCFLDLNPEPSDAQIHSFAAALGVDKEALEAQMYEMLSDCMDCRAGTVCVAHRLLALTEIEEVLQDDYDENAINVDLLPVNDGEKNPAHTEEMQELTDNDGSIVPSVTQELLLDDGLVGQCGV